MICPGQPFWWANMYYDGSLNSVERYYGVTRERKMNSFTLRGDAEAKKQIEDKLHVYKAYKKDELHGEQQFHSRLQLLLDAMNAGGDKAVQLALKAVRNHFDADQTLAHTLQRRCREEYSSKASQNETIKSLEADLRRQVGEGTLSFSEADEKLKSAKREVESNAFRQFYDNGGEERVAAVIWKELASSSERARLLTEADVLEREAKLLLA